ncbi:MAG: hypothetical protein DCF17_00290 [Shackletoniella antarctica]|uniref:Uncharacterized protein n=1 Tax=Shackletoniella antarctica TaxID=268115 RepID=A0A2W4WN63_9CYAN|nr:MAG: hypothetical protein DCF17_00290 [Shackletoniella antarctica]
MVQAVQADLGAAEAQAALVAQGTAVLVLVTLGVGLVAQVALTLADLALVALATLGVDLVVQTDLGMAQAGLGVLAGTLAPPACTTLPWPPITPRSTTSTVMGWWMTLPAMASPMTEIAMGSPMGLGEETIFPGRLGQV